MTSRLHLALSLGALAVGASAGCSPTVGSRETSCDEEIARTVVYRLDGSPMYLGQAILVGSCAGGGSRCHTSRPNPFDRDPRRGAPASLPMNLLPATDGSVADLAELAAIQAIVHRSRNLIWSSVLDGSMPPGEAGAREQPRPEEGQGYFYVVVEGATPVPIPAIAEDEAREYLRNWLACGSPVIERYAPLALGSECVDAGDCAHTGRCEGGSCVACTGNADCAVTHRCLAGRCAAVGDVVPVIDVGLDPTFPEIYARILQPNCTAGAGCHGAFPSGGLDLSTAARARTALFDEASPTDPGGTGAVCGDFAGARVVPGDPDGSLLVEKLRAEPTCGERMPTAYALSPEQVLAIRQWIEAGAP